MCSKRGFLICFIIYLSVQENEADTQCDDFTMEVMDANQFKPMNNSALSYIKATVDDIHSCDYLRVYVELERPLYGLANAKVNFTLSVEDSRSHPSAISEDSTDAGLIALIIFAILLLIVAGYFGYKFLMEWLKSGVYRFPPTTETFQFAPL